MSPFMQQLLKRLLRWLGALGCPVVILSATMPAHLSNELVHSYLAGSGHRRSLADLNAAPSYPGWLFAAAADASLTRMDPDACTAHATSAPKQRVVDDLGGVADHDELGVVALGVEDLFDDGGP
ncbi:hypothetical protein [Streptomyces sp. NPDC000133]|uniref:hypothetical protein n=1 Tax=Streptomyces sp. NPDC000133 TaxID=3364535 RepID=UPI0036AEB1C0